MATQTRKIKVWVPLLCSCILTVYYLFTIHGKSAVVADAPQAVAETPAAVPEATPAAHATPAPVPAPSVPTGAEASDNSAQIRDRANQAHAARQFGDEAKLWDEFMQSAPKPQEACPQIGKAYELAGDAEAAVTAYEKCLSFEPQNEDILTAYAHALQDKGDYNRAAAAYRQCLLKDARNLDAQGGLALIALKQGHLQEAQQAAEKILEKAPHDTDALLIAGIVAWREGRVHDAETIFRKGEGLDEARPAFHAFLGRVAEAENRRDEALREYERALALDPADSDIAARRERLQASR